MLNLLKIYIITLSLTTYLALVSLWLNPGFAYDWILLCISLLLAILFIKPKIEDLNFFKVKDYKFYILILPVLVQAAFVVFSDGVSVYVLHKNNYGDFSFHHHLTKYLQNASFWPIAPYFSTEKLNYAFGSNLLHASLLDTGINSLHLFRLISLIFVVFIAYCAYALGGNLLVAVIFYASGIGWEANELAWKPLYLANYLTQRSYTLTLAFALYFFVVAYDYYKTKLSFHRSDIVVTCLGFMGLALYSYHAYFMLGLMALAIFLFKPSKKYFFILTLAFFLSFYFPLRASYNTDFAPYFLWHGFLPEDTLSFFRAQLQNFLPFYLILIYAILKFKEERYLFATLLSLFVFFQFFILAPWPWDNVKLLIWPFLFALYIFTKCQKSKKNFSVVIFLVLCLAGYKQSIVDSFFVKGYPIWNEQELESMSVLLEGVDNKTFWIEPTYNHPMQFFSYPYLIGYEGHLASHAINYRENLLLAKNLMLREDIAGFYEFLADRNVAYLILTSKENTSFYEKIRQDKSPVRKYKGLSLYEIK